MNTKPYEFRSRRERDKEVDLARNYGQIGNRAVAAASQSCCKQKAGETAARQAGASARRETATSH